jgi:hypothetical protein
MYVIRCRGIAGRNDPDPIVGQYLQDNDFEADEGRGRCGSRQFHAGRYLSLKFCRLIDRPAAGALSATLCHPTRQA